MGLSGKGGLRNMVPPSLLAACRRLQLRFGVSGVLGIGTSMHVPNDDRPLLQFGRHWYLVRGLGLNGHKALSRPFTRET